MASEAVKMSFLSPLGLTSCGGCKAAYGLNPHQPPQVLRKEMMDWPLSTCRPIRKKPWTIFTHIIFLIVVVDVAVSCCSTDGRSAGKIVVVDIAVGFFAREGRRTRAYIIRNAALRQRAGKIDVLRRRVLECIAADDRPHNRIRRTGINPIVCVRIRTGFAVEDIAGNDNICLTIPQADGCLSGAHFLRPPVEGVMANYYIIRISSTIDDLPTNIIKIISYDFCLR